MKQNVTSNEDALLKPLMPVGVDHTLKPRHSTILKKLLKPLMPVGVDHASLW